MNKVNNKKGKLLKCIGFAFVVLVFLGSVAIFTQKPADLDISDVEIALVKDGIYEGNADNGLVKAKVKVDVKNGRIVDISILEHKTLLGKKAEVIKDNIIMAQTLKVDTVTGATYSSDTIKKAVENALRQGE